AAILGKEQALVRIMPNTAVKIGQGVIAMTANDQVSAKDHQAVKDLFQGLGLVAEVSEDQFATITGLSGSSPTIVYMLIEAMSDA
ncbi:pyrroline-5-carboxylate reductase, partial [Klebsiella quasipneumoniae]|nr:pyrroline-5-carboxylate reductase [Klebsiella quasipneumoniae]